MIDLLKQLLETELLLRKCHWNIVGQRFEPLHSFFGSLYEKVADDSDIIAEKVRQDGDFIEIYSVECDYDEREANAMLRIVLDEFSEISSLVSQLSSQAERTKDYGAIDILGKMASEYSKDIWKLNSFLK